MIQKQYNSTYPSFPYTSLLISSVVSGLSVLLIYIYIYIYIAKTNVKIIFSVFYSSSFMVSHWSYVEIFNSHYIDFCVWYKMSPISFSCMWIPSFSNTIY